MTKKKQSKIQTPVKNQKTQKITRTKGGQKQPHSKQKQQPSTIETKKSIQKATSHVGVFSQIFYKRLQQFQNLYKEFLTNKHEYSEKDIQKEMVEVTQKVSNQIQTQAFSIFKNQLQDLENWIVEQIKKIQNQVQTIENAYEQNRQSLINTRAFSEDQVRRQLSPIQAKATAKRNLRQKYEDLLKRSKIIYDEN